MSGYPPEDLILKPLFIEQVIAAVENFATETADGGAASWAHPGGPMVR